MGLDAPILPPGGASRPKLHLRHSALANRTTSGTKIRTGHSLGALKRCGAEAEREEQLMVRKTLELAAVAGLLLLAACNTVSGAGKDVSSAGKAVSNAAEDAK